MANKKSFRKAVVSTIISMMLCISMLVGTTFAWFTDSVTSSGNVIKSGTLKVTMEYSDAVLSQTEDGWMDASKDAIFSYDNWEPGYTSVKYVKIENEGSLDLKYELGIFTDEVAQGVDLASVIEVYAFEGAQVITRDMLVVGNENYVDTLSSIIARADVVTSGVLYADDADKAGETYKIYTLALKMSDNAGNEYQDKTVGGSFAVRLLATQLNSEADSFDKDYDKDADYKVEVESAEELMTAIKQGGNVKMMKDVALGEGEKLTVPAGVVVTLDMNGNTINGGYQEGSDTKHVYAIENRGTLTLKNGTVNARGVGNYGDLTVESGTYNAIDTNGGAAIWCYEGATLTVNGGTFYGADTFDTAGAGALSTAVNTTTVINGGTFISEADKTYAVISRGEMTINDGTYVSDHGTVAAMSGSKMTINGGTYATAAIGKGSHHTVYTTDSEIVINGGSFKHMQVGASNTGSVVISASNSAKVTINGGNFDSVEGAFAYNTAKVEINGGNFANKAKTVYQQSAAVGVKQFVAQGLAMLENGDGTWTVIPATSTETLTLTDGAVLELGEEATIPAKVVVTGDVTIKGAKNPADGVKMIKTLSATEGANITVEDTVTMNNFSFGATATAGANYVIDGDGKIEANYGFFQHGNYELYADFATGYMYYSYGSDITVYGTFESEGKGDGLDYVRGTVTIANGGRSIHKGALWVGQPASWGAMSATLIVEEGAYVEAKSLCVYAGSELKIDGTNAVAGEIINIVCKSLTVEGTVSVINNDALTVTYAGNKFSFVA